MIVTDAMIIKYLVETIRYLNEHPEVRVRTDMDMFGENSFFFYKEDVKKFKDLKFEVEINIVNEKVNVKFLEI